MCSIEQTRRSTGKERRESGATLGLERRPRHARDAAYGVELDRLAHSAIAPSASSSKPLLTSVGDGVERLAGLRRWPAPGCRARAGAQHHQAHDRVAVHRRAVAGHRDLGVEALGGAHERAEARAWRPLRLTMVICCASARPAPPAAVFIALPSVSLATLMYLRPASAASRTASLIERSPRTRASLTSIGRLTPGDHFDAARLHHRDREVGGRAAEHVGEDDDAVARYWRCRRTRGCRRGAPPCRRRGRWRRSRSAPVDRRRARVPI